MSTHTLLGQALVENGVVLDAIIGQLLGQGLGYDDWKRKLQNLGGFTWNESIKNIIIKKEFGFFREEILLLMSEPNKSRRLKSKTNSLESILKRLQGLEWVKGMPNEMEQRKRYGRLLGKDAKARCLQYHVKRWKAEAASESLPLRTATTNSEDHGAMLSKQDTEAISSNLTLTARSPSVVTSQTKASTKLHSSNDRQFPDGDCFTFRKPLQISKPNMSSMLTHNAPLLDFDSTLYGDYEIPWVPPSPTQETGSHGADITLEEFYQFVEHNPNFPTEPNSTEPSFELPRGQGVNDSYEIYISEVCKDPNTQRTIIEEILDSYGSQPSKDISLAGLTQENTAHVSGSSQFKQQQTSAEVTTFSQENFGISPQDLMHNDCRSDAYTDQLPHRIEIDALTLGNISSSESSQGGDQETNSCQSRDQNEPFTPVPRTAKTASQLFYNREPASGQTLDQHNNQLYHIQAKLLKKREELAAAEATVSNLRNEIKLLEASANRHSRHFEDTMKHKTNHKRANEEILHGAKRLKERVTTVTFAPAISEDPNVNGGETFCLNDLHFSTAKGPPRIITTCGERVYHSFNQNNINNSRPPETLLAGIIQNPDQSLQSTSNDTCSAVALRVERSSPVPPLKKQTPCSALVDESRERLSDPGRDFLERGLVNCRACSIENLGQGVAWVAPI